MKSLVVGITLAIVATPAFASRHPSYTTNGVTYFDPAAVPAYAPDRPAVRHRRAFIHHHKEKSRLTKINHSSTQPPAHRPVLRYATPHRTAPQVETSVLTVLSAITGVFEGFADGMSMPRPQVIARRPRLLTGTLTISGKRFAYASGGHGWSIPYGDFPITPEDVGRWGHRHGAIGINGDTIPDKQLGRDREGIEIHASHHMASAGCVVVEEFDQLKHSIFAMIESVGHAWLHVGPSGAAITPNKESPLPPVIYLAQHITEEEEQHSTRKHKRFVHHNLPHRRYYAHRHHQHYARA